MFIKEEIEIVKIENSIGKKVKNKLDKSNKEYFLREQLKVIQEELGEDDEKNEIDNYAEKINKAKMPKELTINVILHIFILCPKDINPLLSQSLSVSVHHQQTIF